MLSQAENELITQVGPGTPMGELMRQYWAPALLSSELSADGDPRRVLLLGEQLIAFRDTKGQVGLVQNACPHRGASLFFGRNEECGLRCVYHGWKFDVSGACVDMPNEPTESNFKHKVRATAYPTQERGGVVWAYLGPRELPPPLPNLEANMLGEASSAIAYEGQCNWLQILEGDIDTVHSGFLHRGSLDPDKMPKDTFMEYQIRERAPHYELFDTEGGSCYGAYREAKPGFDYWRIAQWLFPFYSMAPAGLLGLGKGLFARVPMDDTHTMSYLIAPRSTNQIRRPGAGDGEGGRPQMLPDSTDWVGRFRFAANAANDWGTDRQKQRANVGRQGYSGINGTLLQDAAVTGSMGPVFDRSTEHLGSSDLMIIRVRRRLLAAAQALMRDGAVPPGVDHPDAYAVRSGGALLPQGVNWIEATAELRKAFVEHPELDPSIVGVA